MEHANFFEALATEYSKAATRGNWNDGLSSFDSRRKARANDGGDAVGANEDEGEDMFRAAGIAAE